MPRKSYYTAEELARNARHVTIRRSPLGGYGAFAKTPLRRGSLLGYMKGPVVAHDGIHVLWKEQPGGKWKLIEVQGPMKYINHSEKPNVELVERCGVTVVKALKSIEAGEEIFFAYDTSEGTHFTITHPKPHQLGAESLAVWHQIHRNR